MLSACARPSGWTTGCTTCDERAVCTGAHANGRTSGVVQAAPTHRRYAPWRLLKFTLGGQPQTRNPGIGEPGFPFCFQASARRRAPPRACSGLPANPMPPLDKPVRHDGHDPRDGDATRSGPRRGREETESPSGQQGGRRPWQAARSRSDRHRLQAQQDPQAIVDQTQCAAGDRSKRMNEPGLRDAPQLLAHHEASPIELSFRRLDLDVKRDAAFAGR